MYTSHWANKTLMIPTAPSGVITLTRHGEDVEITRRFYGSADDPATRPVTFHIPFLALKDFVDYRDTMDHAIL